jgi:hypothetical protein
LREKMRVNIDRAHPSAIIVWHDQWSPELL